MDLNGINLLVLDVDGVLTPGDVTFDDALGRSMSFSIHDGRAMRMWKRAGHRLAVLSGRRSSIVDRRATELGVDVVRQGVKNKGDAFNRLLADIGGDVQRCCYVGDDLPDLAPIRGSAFGVAVANAVPTVKRHAHYVTRRPGGGGAVAEIIELILRRQNRWTELAREA